MPKPMLAASAAPLFAPPISPSARRPVPISGDAASAPTRHPKRSPRRSAPHYGAQHHALRDLANLEADQPGDYSRLVRALHAHGAFAFNLPVFYTLAAATCDAGLDDCHAA